MVSAGRCERVLTSFTPLRPRSITPFVSRSRRLLELLQVLRRHRRPVRGRDLADELGVSMRTLYRDIATLQAQGAPIAGEAGLGYVLRPGFTLPPLMFTTEELEALALGSRWVMKQPDRDLARAAADALAKIAAVLPAALREQLDATTLLVGPRDPAVDPADLGLLRAAIRGERKLRLTYDDATGARTERTIWPFAMGFFDRQRVLVAWCETRQDFRHFHTDRIRDLRVTDLRYPQRRQALLRRWRAVRGHPEQT